MSQKIILKLNLAAKFAIRNVLFVSLIFGLPISSLKASTKADLDTQPVASFFEPQAETLKKINSEDSDAEATLKIVNLHDKRSYKSCSETAVKDLASEAEDAVFYVFKFIFGVKCLVEIKSLISKEKSLLKLWSDLYFVMLNKDILKYVHGSEGDLYLNYILKLSEIIYSNQENLDLTIEQIKIVENNLKNTEDSKIKTKIFAGYLNRNDQLSAKEFMVQSDPKLQDIPSLEMLAEHFKDEVYNSRIQELKKSKVDSKELKNLYNRNKYSEFLKLLVESDLIYEDSVGAASRQAGWLYVRGSDQFKNELASKVDQIDVNFNEFFWVLSNQGYFKDILKLYKQLNAAKQKTNITMALKAYIYSGQYAEGFKFVQDNKLIDDLVKQRPVVLFYAALIGLRFNKDKQILPVLKHLMNTDSEYKLQAMYLNYNILKDLKDNDYKKEASKLVQFYPLTYYGLVVAHNESLTQDLPFLKSTPEPKVNFKFDVPEEKRKLKHLVFINTNNLNSRFRKFMDSTLNSLSFESQMIFAYKFHMEGEPLAAIKVMNVVWTSRRDWIHPSITPIAYPKGYLESVKKHSVANIDPFLVLGLIRQESAFQKNATSQSSARGLMQLLTGTAKEMARSLRLYKVSLPWGLYSPDVNIRLGSFYLKKRIEAYKGHVPMALASYNVGPGRLQKWSVDRNLITSLQDTMYEDSWKVQDLWVEEMPWEETRFYVKAVLRNYYLYTLFEDYSPLKTCFRRWNCEPGKQLESTTEKSASNSL